MRVRDHEAHAGKPPLPEPQQEAAPRHVGLAVRAAQPHHLPRAVLACGHRGHDGRRARRARLAARDVGRVQPQVGPALPRQVAASQLCDLGVQAGAQPRHPRAAHRLHAHAGHDLLDLSRGHAGGPHVAHRRGQRRVGARPLLDDVVGKVGSFAKLRDPEGDRAHAGVQPALAIPVSRGSELGGLLVHHGVQQFLEKPPGH